MTFSSKTHKYLYPFITLENLCQKLKHQKKRSGGCIIRSVDQIKFISSAFLLIVKIYFICFFITYKFIGSKNGVSNFSAVFNDCRRLLVYDLVTFNIRFIRRQINEVAHNFTRVDLRHAIFHIHIKISFCISTIIMNEIQ